MYFKSILVSFLCLVLFSCSNGIIGDDYQENLAKLDKVYGYCDNPQRNLNKSSVQYKICKDKEAAAGADGLSDDDFKLPFLDKILNQQGSSANVIYTSRVNPYLWNGAINTLNDYPLSFADSNGGFIETDWIYNSNLDNQRCLIKVQITSQELLSNAVETKILCQGKIKENWINTKETFLNEEKQITLAILNSATKYSSEDKID